MVAGSLVWLAQNRDQTGTGTTLGYVEVFRATRFHLRVMTAAEAVALGFHVSTERYYVVSMPTIDELYQPAPIGEDQVIPTSFTPKVGDVIEFESGFRLTVKALRDDPSGDADEFVVYAGSNA